MAKKVYAVLNGRHPGIYHTWAQCQEQIHGFSGAVYKSFSSLAQAEEYMNMGAKDQAEQAQQVQTEAIAYVDGSYQADSREFSCGVVLFHNGGEEHFSERYCDRELAQMHNVAGEIMGARKAIQYCLDNQIKSVTIFHDYEGIAKWCTGQWQAKKAGTKEYQAFYDQAKKKMEIHFVKVKGHSGDQYNDLADQLARQAFQKTEK